MKSCFLTFMFFVLCTYVYGADDQNSISSIHTRLGEAIQQSDWNGVLRLSEKLVKKDPYNLWSHYYHGLGLTNTGNLKAGEKALKKVIKKDKKHFWANYILFFNYDRQNHTKTKTQAKKVETLITAEVLKSNPADIRYFYSAFAGYYTRTEDRKNTKKVLKAGLKKLPKDPLLRSQYAFTFFRVDMKKWKKLARKTLALVSEKEQKAINTYTFPLKGGPIKIHQGNNSTISHLGLLNGYCYDFVYIDKKGKYGSNEKKKEGHLIFGKPVYATRAGTVISVIDNSLDTDPRKNDPSAEANTITLLHDNNEVSIYAHLKQDSAKVKIGEQVKAGHHIGNIGCSGKYVDFPHLHFGVFRNGLSVEAKLTGMSLKKKGRWKAMDAFVPKENDVVRTD